MSPKDRQTKGASLRLKVSPDHFEHTTADHHAVESGIWKLNMKIKTLFHHAVKYESEISRFKNFNFSACWPMQYLLNDDSK